jgi:hypothetical protein
MDKLYVSRKATSAQLYAIACWHDEKAENAPQKERKRHADIADTLFMCSYKKKG